MSECDFLKIGEVKNLLTLCTFWNFHTALSAAVLLAVYKMLPGVFDPSSLSLIARSSAEEAQSSSVKVYSGSSLGFVIEATEAVTTTDVNCGPALSADSRAISVPLTAGITVSSKVSREKSTGDAV